jgi:hypothetical protein
MDNNPKESDWKIFRKRVPEWRERYLHIRNRDILEILTDKDKTPTEQFWGAKKKMDDEAKMLRVCLDGHSRSKMFYYLYLMYQRGLVCDGDLDEFSTELKERMLGMVK